MVMMLSLFLDIADCILQNRNIYAKGAITFLP